MEVCQERRMVVKQTNASSGVENKVSPGDNIGSTNSAAIVASIKRQSFEIKSNLKLDIPNILSTT